MTFNQRLPRSSRG